MGLDAPLPARSDSPRTAGRGTGQTLRGRGPAHRGGWTSEAGARRGEFSGGAVGAPGGVRDSGGLGPRGGVAAGVVGGRLPHVLDGTGRPTFTILLHDVLL